MTRTSLYSILCIGIRLAAVLLAVETLIGLPGALHAVTYGEWQADAWLISGVFVGVLVLAFLLWVFPGTLARLAAGKASQEVFESPIAAVDLQYIAFSVIGLRYLIGGAYGLISDGLRESITRRAMMALNKDTDSIIFHHADFTASIVANSFEIVAGIALLYGARGLVGFLRRTRHAGLPAAMEE